MLCRSQNGFEQVLQGFYTLHESQNGPSELYKAAKRFATDVPKIYYVATRFTEVKTTLEGCYANTPKFY